MAGLLDRFAVLRTSDLDDARAAVAQRYCDHRLSLTRGRTLDAKHNHVRGRHVSFNLLGYGGDVHINPGELRDFYLVQIPLAGQARIHHRGEDVEASPTRATILNPDRPTRMDWDAACTKLMVQIDAAFLHDVAEEEIGAALPGPIRFDPGIDLRTCQGQKLKQFTLAAAGAFDRDVLCDGRQGLRELSIEREISKALLDLQPSNISHILARAGHRPRPGPLRRAVAFINDSYHLELRLHDIAAACDVHPRSLQSAFKDQMGVTPMTYLKQVRLDAARYRLSARMARESVTDVAYACGFTHLGRFSQEYRARFGHKPSAAP